jgi:16S rRNA A1518/A1519 N6-dimethyltransferase RsmA/KsgA/DIM1 with predicted DNA glycosylase/AP lyase activity
VNPLSQYFLTAPGKLAALVDAAGIRPTDRVVELGAGAGTVAAALPPCTSLTLVELDPRYAAELRRRFPGAAVVEGDALELVERLPCDVLLGNLPHDVTDRLLPMLPRLRFRTAVVSAAPGAEPPLPWTEVTRTSGADFVPFQPVESRVLRITH